MPRAEHWYAVETPPQKERACEALLKRAGFTPWIPTHKVRKKVGRAPVRFENVDKPFIPSLIFADTGADISENMELWLRLSGIRLVKSIIGVAGIPRSISKGQIDRMAETRGQLHILELARAEAARIGAMPEVDSRVSVSEGAFSGLHGTVKELHGYRAKVLLQIFGSTRDVEIGVAQLIAAE